MPFARIDVDATRSDVEVKAISDGVYNALVESVHAPAGDKFHVVSKREPGSLIFSRDYLGIQRSDHFVSIQIFLYAGRTVEQKKLIYKTITDKLVENPGVKKEDVMIMLVDTPKENWSYGNGEAQFASSVSAAPTAPAGFSDNAWLAPVALGFSIMSLIAIAVLFFKRA